MSLKNVHREQPRVNNNVYRSRIQTGNKYFADAISIPARDTPEFH